MSRSFLAAIVLGIIVAGCSSEERTAPSAPVPVGEIRVANAGFIDDSVPVLGVVHAETAATLTSRIVGNVTAVRVNEGDRVRRGDLLLTIDASDLETQRAKAMLDVRAMESASGAARGGLEGAEANARLARSTYERYQALRARSSVSAQEFDEVEARYRAANAERDRALKAYEQTQSARQTATAGATLAATQWSWSRITAPFDGVVTARWVDAGAQAAPGVPLLAIESTGRYRVDASIDEDHAALLRAGQSVNVVLRNGGAVIPGAVAHLSPAPDSVSRSYLAKISLPADPRLTSGLSVTVRVPAGSRAGVSVPRSAIVDRGDLKQIWVVDRGDVARLRYVTTGTMQTDSVEVLSGLAAGERFVTDAHQPLTDGTRVVASSKRIAS